MPSDYAKNFVQNCLKITKIEGPVLDAGAADYAYWYAPMFPDMVYHTLDPDPQFKSIVDYDFEICSFPKSFKEKYGVILMLETLEHVKNPFCAFKAISAILKPGGYLILTTVACFGVHRHPFDYWRFLPDGLEELCKESGLKVLINKLSHPDTTRTCHIALLAHKMKVPDEIQNSKN